MLEKVRFAVTPGPTGLYNFAQRLEEYFTSRGVEVVYRGGAQVTLAFADQIPCELIDWASFVVMRVDGTYWNSEVDFVAQNAPLNKIFHSANAVIYQSNFSSKLCGVYLGKRVDPSKDVVIPNGIKLPTILPTMLKKKDPPRIASAARWRPFHRLRDVIATFEYASRKENWFFWLGGVKNIDVSPVLERSLVLADSQYFLPTTDVFIYLSPIDNCPNMIIEALACSVPIVCTNGGGVKELVGDAGIVLDVDKVDETYPSWSYLNEEKVSRVPVLLVYDAICQILDNYDIFKARVLERRKLFDIEKVGELYLEVLEDAIKA